MSVLGIVLLFLYFNLISWQASWLGIILFIFFILLTGGFWQEVLARIFKMKLRDTITMLFGWFTCFLILGFISAVFVVWYTLTPFLIWLCFLITAILTLFIWFLSKRGYKKVINDQRSTINYYSTHKFAVFKGYHLSFIIFIILWLVAAYFLFISQTTETLQSPWQTISPYFLPIFFFLTLILGFIVFSKYKVKAILFFIILHSILLHIYLPLSHKMPWGGDVWRHAAVEQEIIQGNLELPVIAGLEAQWREVVGINLPEALIIPHKYVYGHLWGTTILLNQTLGINLISLNKWLIPLLWSIFLPLIFFRIGKLLFGSWRKGLLLSFLAFIPFPFQALGGLTLPVSLGYLVFFFVLMLWFDYLQDGRLWQRRIAILFSVLMLFGYTLHSILIWFIIILIFLLRKISDIRYHGSKIFKYQFSIFKSISTILLCVFCILIFPVIELVAKTSYFPASWNVWEQLRQLVGQFSGWYYASAIRPHDILSGNILFNHTPDFAYVPSLFTDWRWHVLVVMILIIATAKYGFFKLFKTEDITVRVFQLLSLSVVGGYIIGWFVLEGDRSFVRRLDALFAFVVIVFFIYGISQATRHISQAKKLIKIFFFVVILALSWFATTSYASGPDMRVVSENEFNVARFVWDHIDQSQENYCVLADTWILLPLEGLSGQKIVGGGFPIDYQFGQKERVNLLKDMTEQPNIDLFDKIHELIKIDKCWIVLSQVGLNENIKEKIVHILDVEPHEIGNFYVWEEGLKEEE